MHKYHVNVSEWPKDGSPRRYSYEVESISKLLERFDRHGWYERKAPNHYTEYLDGCTINHFVTRVY